MPYGNCGDYYGRGDYYRGDYYRGDPGIFGSIGKVFGSIAKAVVPAPIRAAVDVVAGAIRRPSTAIQLPPPARPPVLGLQGGVGLGYFNPAGGGVGIGYFPPGPGQDVVGPGMSLTPQGALVPCQMKGYRLNKSGYYRHPRGAPEAAVYVPARSVCVRSRRINVANPRALRRAIRRAQGFAKLARRVMTFVSAKAPKGRAKFKRK